MLSQQVTTEPTPIERVERINAVAMKEQEQE